MRGERELMANQAENGCFLPKYWDDGRLTTAEWSRCDSQMRQMRQPDATAKCDSQGQSKGNPRAMYLGSRNSHVKSVGQQMPHRPLVHAHTFAFAYTHRYLDAHLGDQFEAPQPGGGWA